MKQTLSRVAAILAFIVGTMAIFAGGQVLSGRDPGYYVIDWLPLYNFVMGVVAVVVVAPLIWRTSKWARPAAVATLAAHAAVMVILRTAYSDVVAPDSLRAMTIRTVAWLLILALMFAQARRSRPTSA